VALKGSFQGLPGRGYFFLPLDPKEATGKSKSEFDLNPPRGKAGLLRAVDYFLGKPELQICRT